MQEVHASISKSDYCNVFRTARILTHVLHAWLPVCMHQVFYTYRVLHEYTLRIFVKLLKCINQVDLVMQQHE